MDTWNEQLVVGETSQGLLIKLLTELGFSVQLYLDGKAKEADLVINMTIELKRDVLSATTGNYAIEYLFKGKPSGISTTTSTIFAIQTDTHFHLYHTSKLKAFLKANWKQLKHTKGGDDGETELILVPKLQMLDPWLVIPIAETPT